MRLRTLLFAGVVLLFAVSVAQANTIQDPGVIFKPGTGSIPVGLNFPIPTLNGNGNGNFVFINKSGMTMFNLKLFVSPGPPAGSTYSCALQLFPGLSVPYFTSCQFQQTGPTGTSLVFFGGAGIPKGQEFALDFTGWPGGSNFKGAANVPEPVTVSLMLLGMGALGLKRRLSRG
jgi:hypothetical protein